MVIFLILIIVSLDYLLLLLRGNWLWSLLGLAESRRTFLYNYNFTEHHQRHTGLTPHTCLRNSDSYKKINTKCWTINFNLLIRFSFTLKYSSELSINSESKNRRDKSYLSFRCFWVGFCSCTAILYLVSAVNLVPRSLVYEAEGETWCDRMLGTWQAMNVCMLEINPQF